MKSLSTYLLEQLLLEYRNYNVNSSKFNFKLESTGKIDHSSERMFTREISDSEIRILVQDVWRKIEKGIKQGKILINQRNSNKQGSSISIHSYDKTKSGYLTVIVFVKKYDKNKDFYTLEVVTAWKVSKITSYKDKDPKTGKTMYHPETGQIDIWPNFAIEYLGMEDSINLS